MRIRTANNRKARRKRAATTEVPFCYLEYAPSFEVIGIGMGMGKRKNDDVSLRCIKKINNCYPYVTYIGPAYLAKPKQRNFPNYAHAIAHLTKLKLSLCEDDKEYTLFTPCKIVEGYATKGKQTITKVTELPDVSSSVQSQRQSVKARKR